MTQVHDRRHASSCTNYVRAVDDASQRSAGDLRAKELAVVDQLLNGLDGSHLAVGDAVQRGAHEDDCHPHRCVDLEPLDVGDLVASCGDIVGEGCLGLEQVRGPRHLQAFGDVWKKRCRNNARPTSTPAGPMSTISQSSTATGVVR